MLSVLSGKNGTAADVDFVQGFAFVRHSVEFFCRNLPCPPQSVFTKWTFFFAFLFHFFRLVDVPQDSELIADRAAGFATDLEEHWSFTSLRAVSWLHALYIHKIIMFNHSILHCGRPYIVQLLIIAVT